MPWRSLLSKYFSQLFLQCRIMRNIPFAVTWNHKKKQPPGSALAVLFQIHHQAVSNRRMRLSNTVDLRCADPYATAIEGRIRTSLYH